MRGRQIKRGSSEEVQQSLSVGLLEIRERARNVVTGIRGRKQRQRANSRFQDAIENGATLEEYLEP